LEKIADQQMLFAFGLNHKTAPIEVREKLYITEAEIPEVLARLKENLSECIILSTCNRTEIYGVCDSAGVDLDFYKDLIIDFKTRRIRLKKSISLRLFPALPVNSFSMWQPALIRK
jgi:glutamyl-tRNA reductase